jgi:hypothetical protein
MVPTIAPLSSDQKNLAKVFYSTVAKDSFTEYSKNQQALLDAKVILSTAPLFFLLKEVTSEEIEKIRAKKNLMVGKEFELTRWNAPVYLSNFAYQKLFFEHHEKLQKDKTLLDSKQTLLKEETALKQNFENLNLTLAGKTPGEQQLISDQIMVLAQQISENKYKLDDCKELEQLYTAYNLNGVINKYFETVRLTEEEGSRTITTEMVDAQFTLIDAYRRAELTAEEVDLTVAAQEVDLTVPVIDREAVEKAFEDAENALKKATATKNNLSFILAKEEEKTRAVMKKLAKIESLPRSLYIFLNLITFGILGLDLFFTKKAFAAKIGDVIKMDKANAALIEAETNFEAAKAAKEALPPLILPVEEVRSTVEEVMQPAEEVRPPVEEVMPPTEVTGKSKAVKALKVGGSIAAAVGAAVLAGPVGAGAAIGLGVAYFTNRALNHYFKR